MRDQAQDQSNAQPSRPAHIYGFGSSSSEVLDYIFGDSPRYHSYWASGWSGRGLRKKDNRDYVLRCLRQAEPQDVILLHFGMVDAVFNAAIGCRRAISGSRMPSAARWPTGWRC